MTNEQTIYRIVKNTFEEIDVFSKLIIMFEIFLTRKIEPAMQNMIYGFFFQSALLCPILTHFEKNISKCVHLVPNLTHFEKYFQSA